MQTFLLLDTESLHACSLFDALSTNRANLTILLYLFDFVLSCRKGWQKRGGPNLTVGGLNMGGPTFYDTAGVII